MEPEVPGADGFGAAAGPTPNGGKGGPVERMHDTNVSERLEGIVAQCRADMSLNDQSSVATLVTSRLRDAGIDLADDEVARLVDRIVNTTTAPRHDPGVHPGT